MNKFITLLIIFYSSTAQAKLAEFATVIDANGRTTDTTIDWDYHDVPVNQEEGTVRKFAGRVPLTRLNAAKYTVQIDGSGCSYEGNELVVYLTDREVKCLFKLGTESLLFQISADTNYFDNQPDQQCSEMYINISPVITDPLPGFFSMACEETENGFRLTVAHSANLSMSQSRLHESYGKYENYKTWEFFGLGKLTGQRDLILNQFVLTDQGTQQKKTITIRRKAFKFVRTSPFEVDVGLGIANVSTQNKPQGETSVAFLRVNVGIGYLISRWLFKLDTAADVIGLDGNEDPAKSAYFYYNSDILFGYRYAANSRNIFEILPGVTFSKYSFQIANDRRLYTRQGAGLKLLYRQVDRNLTDFYVQLGYTDYLLAGNNTLQLKSGTRLFGSKVTLWGSFEMQKLASAGSPLGSDQGQMITIGGSLDF